MEIPHDMADLAEVSHNRARPEFKKLWDKRRPSTPWHKAYKKPTIAKGSKLYEQFMAKLLQLKLLQIAAM